jgi:phospholipid/cholesterol/gamma-HCH transport system substrate-binding protein
MASQKVASAQFRVGLLAIIAMAILGVAIFLLSGTNPLFRDEVTLYTYLSDSAALAVGSPVRINGILAGKVSKVELTTENDPRRNIKVTLEVNKSLINSIPDDSKAAISAENLLGSKYLNISRGKSRSSLKPGGEIPAVDTRQFDEIVQKGYDITDSAQGILVRVERIVKQIESGEGTLGKFIKDEALYRQLVVTVKELQTASASVNKILNNENSTVGKLLYSPELYNEVRETLKKMDAIVATVERGDGAIGKFVKDPSIYNDSQKTILEMRSLLANLNAGKGTAGQLLKDDQLAKQLSATLTKLNTTIDRLNEGRGTLGQLLVNPQLYDNLNATSADISAFIKDFRANPKKFLSIKLGLF